MAMLLPVSQRGYSRFQVTGSYKRFFWFEIHDFWGSENFGGYIFLASLILVGILLDSKNNGKVCGRKRLLPYLVLREHLLQIFHLSMVLNKQTNMSIQKVL